MAINYKVKGWFGSTTGGWRIELEPKFFEDIEEARLYAVGLHLANEESHTETYEVEVLRVLERGPALKVLTYSA
jgi:hypothetical protein